MDTREPLRRFQNRHCRTSLLWPTNERQTSYILNFKKGSGGFFHNTLVAVASETARQLISV